MSEYHFLKIYIRLVGKKKRKKSMNIHPGIKVLNSVEACEVLVGLKSSSAEVK